MRILALDPAEYKIGWAVGDAGTLPKVGVLRLRLKKEERTEEAVEKFAQWLRNFLTTNEVNLLAVEHFLPHGAKLGETTDFVREGQIGLNYAARAVAAICNVPFRSPMPSTIRKYFIGRASMGSRSETKRAVIKQAQLLGYLAKDDVSDDAADAAALWDFSASHFAHRASPEFVLT